MHWNLTPANFSTRPLPVPNFGGERGFIAAWAFVPESYCHPLSPLKCDCPDYPAVRHWSNWVREEAAAMAVAVVEGRRGGGVCEWDAQWPRHHHKPPVWSNILTDELNECAANPSPVASTPSYPPPPRRFSISQRPYWTAILPWVTTVAAVCSPCPPPLSNALKTALKSSCKCKPAAKHTSTLISSGSIRLPMVNSYHSAGCIGWHHFEG